MPWLLHITSTASWAQDRVSADTYTPPSLITEGFLHCSTPQQIEAVANTLFQGQPELLLLVIDPDRLAAPVIYEDCYASGQAFPHIYGPLNVTAIQSYVRWRPGADGRFSLPELPGAALPI